MARLNTEESNDFFLSMKVLYGRFLCKKDLSTNYDVGGRNKKKHFNVDLNFFVCTHLTNCLLSTSYRRVNNNNFIVQLNYKYKLVKVCSWCTCI